MRVELTYSLIMHTSRMPARPTAVVVVASEPCLARSRCSTRWPCRVVAQSWPRCKLWRRCQALVVDAPADA